ncbi:MAG: hypothetical protein H0T11_07655, partial [Chthoniobacterales bacterium]|nr:hypothetical protein [Chthoniobacterales bacterium]
AILISSKSLCTSCSSRPISAVWPDTAAKLREIGHTLRERTSYEGANQGDAETIAINPETTHRLGASDPRKADEQAIGY